VHQASLRKSSPVEEQPASHQQAKTFGMSRCYICLTTPLIHERQKATSSHLPCCLYYLGFCERFLLKEEETHGSGSLMVEWAPPLPECLLRGAEFPNCYKKVLVQTLCFVPPSRRAALLSHGVSPAAACAPLLPLLPLPLGCPSPEQAWL